MANEKELGTFIKLRREELGYSQQDIADKIDTSRSVVSRWERGQIGNMGITNAKALADTLMFDPLIIVNGLPEELKSNLFKYLKEDYVNYYYSKDLDIAAHLDSDSLSAKDKQDIADILKLMNNRMK